MIVLLIFAFIIVILILALKLPVFGKNPSGERLDRIYESPNYKYGSFQNPVPTEVILKSASFFKMLIDFFNKPKSTVPEKPLPIIKTNLATIPAEQLTLVWFGHSSYFIKSKSLRVLVDPVFKQASPFSFFGKPFPGTEAYGPDDFDEIDLLILTHDHYDHLEYQTIKSLSSKVKMVCTSLGVGEHLECWGIDQNKIIELNWWEKVEGEEIELTAAPARHFSGRKFLRGKTLWSSFVLSIHGYRLYIGGDSGYGSHFAEIGEKYGPFDIAMLEIAQYGDNWPYIHMQPEQAVMAALDLKAKIILPVHWGKFALAYHAWDDPIRRLVKSAAEKQVKLTTPKIGEPVVLGRNIPNTEWWLL